MIPEAKLKIETQMTNPVKPVGVHVQIHGITVGVMTVQYFEQVMAQLQELKMRYASSIPRRDRSDPEGGIPGRQL